jgi:hypothetical protein
MAREIYSDDQLLFLENGCLWMAIGRLTVAFNSCFGLEKTERQISSAMKNHRIRGGRAVKSGRRPSRGPLLTAEEKIFVEKMYKVHSITDLTAALNRRFGLAVKTSQLKTYVFNHGIKSGRDGCFVKGDLPWNTGTKGTGICKPNSGCFVKGNIPGNIRPVGAERIDTKDGYVHVKVNEENPYTGAKTRFKGKHVVEWEKHNGPVPEGMVVRLIDGNNENCEPENLLLVTRAEHLRLTQLEFGAYPEEIKRSVVALARLEVKTFARSRELRRV